jgi:lanosterol synthase
LLREFQIKKWQSDFPSSDVPKTSYDAAKKGVSFYQILQCEDGHWAGDYGGPMFLLPGLVFVLYVTKVEIPGYKKEAMKAYLRNHQQEDGGWGSHIECASTMFGSVLSYVSLRLLGAQADDDYMVAARSFILSHGGALYAPSWAKFWLVRIKLFVFLFKR